MADRIYPELSGLLTSLSAEGGSRLPDLLLADSGVSPVLPIDRFVMRDQVSLVAHRYLSADLGAGHGDLKAYTVPKGQEERLLQISITGTNNLAGQPVIYFVDPSTAYRHYYQVFPSLQPTGDTTVGPSGNTDYAYVHLPQYSDPLMASRVVLPANWEVHVTYNAGTALGFLLVTILAEVTTNIPFGR